MKKNLFYSFIANLVNAGFSWLMLIFIIRYGTKTDIGLFGLAQAIALPIHMFFTLKLRTIQLSDIEQKYQNYIYAGSRLYLAIANFIFTIIFSIILYHSSLKSLSIIIALSIYYSTVIFREYYISIYQINERNDYLLYSNLIQNVLTILTFALSFIWSKDIVLSTIVYAITRVLLTFIDNIFYKNLSPHHIVSLLEKSVSHYDEIWHLIKRSIPLGITSIIGALLTSIPRFQLEKSKGLEELGVFTTLMSLVVIINLFMNSFVQALLPRMSKSYFNNVKEFTSKSFIFFFIISVFLMCVLLVSYYFSDLLIYIAFGKKYIDYQYEFFLAMLSGCVLCYFHFSNFLLNVQRSFDQQLLIYSFSAFSCYIASVYFIPVYGLKGAIFTTIISSFTGILLSLLVFIRNLSRKV